MSEFKVMRPFDRVVFYDTVVIFCSFLETVRPAVFAKTGIFSLLLFDSI